MEVFECIKTRRSVRRFEDRPVERETIQKIVDAAIWAPSWKNSQTPRYTMVDKREIIDDIAENGCCDFAFNTKTLKQTPVLIVVSYVKGICGFEKDGSYSTDKKEGWQMFDAGVAAQTFALAAHAQGVGTVMLVSMTQRIFRKSLAFHRQRKLPCYLLLDMKNLHQMHRQERRQRTCFASCK